MSNTQRMYAVPTNPFTYTPEELAQMRSQLETCEVEARRATTWSTKTRWEQEANSLRGRIRGAELEETRDRAQQQARQRARPMTHAEVVAQGIKDGRYMPVRSPYGEAGNAKKGQSEIELEQLRAEAKKLQALVDDPNTGQRARTHAQIRLTQVRERISILEAALNPVKTEIPGTKKSTVGHAANSEPMTFEKLKAILNEARAAGVISVYDIRKPKA